MANSRVYYTSCDCYSTTSDRDSQLSKLKAAGENGDVEAQYALGLMYLYGEILDVDYQQAKIWYEKAAAQNDAQAQFDLGVMNERGEGGNINTGQAITWFGLACKNGHKEGCKRQKYLLKSKGISE